MKMTNAQIINNLNMLDSVLSLQLPVNVMYKIRKNVKSLLAEYQNYDEFLKEIQQKYTVKGILDEKDANYQTEYHSLLAVESDINVITVDSNIFENSDFPITLLQLQALEFMFDNEV